MNSNGMQIIILAVFIGLMYLLLIRPQKKKDKQIQDMRNGLQVGDEIVTIGGIYGKIVKTKDDTIVIQVGADKVKMEMAKWSVSSVVAPSKNPKAKAKDVEEEEPKKALPKKLRKAKEEAAEEPAPQEEAAPAAEAEAEPTEE